MHRAVLTALAVAASALTASVAPAGAAAPPVTPADVEPRLKALADIAAANGNTRAAGTPGYTASADYVAGQLRAAGWTVRTQPVKFPFWRVASPPVLGDLKAGDEFVVTRLSGKADGTGRLRALPRRSCSARGVRRREIAVVRTYQCDPLALARAVKARGGLAIVFAAGRDTTLIPATFERTSAVPVIEAKPSRIRALLARGGAVRVKVDAATVTATANNVIADLPGTGKTIMAGGHLDSVLDGPGLNDNGSGVAALLEVAERLPAEPRKRPLRLGFWTAEEYGLLGSIEYARRIGRERLPREIGAYVNLDMVGSPNGEMEVYDSDDALERRFRALLPGDEGETDIEGNSDHAAFEYADVPVTGLYTGSSERGPGGKARDACYHKACDGLANVDRELAAAAATATERLMAELAAG